MNTRSYSIKATVLFENAFWVGIFEKNDHLGYAVARKVFGSEPSDVEFYEFILASYDELSFSTTPHGAQLIKKERNPKRVHREARKELEKMKKGNMNVGYAQEVLRLELEKNKKTRKSVSRDQKQAEEERKFQLKQEKKKKKQRGH